MTRFAPVLLPTDARRAAPGSVLPLSLAPRSPSHVRRPKIFFSGEGIVGSAIQRNILDPRGTPVSERLVVVELEEARCRQR